MFHALTVHSHTLTLLHLRRPLLPLATLLPYTTLFRSPFSSTTPSTRTTARSATCTVERRCVATRTVRPATRSEEHTSELQSLTNLVCSLLLEKKKIQLCIYYHQIAVMV